MLDLFEDNEKDHKDHEDEGHSNDERSQIIETIAARQTAEIVEDNETLRRNEELLAEQAADERYKDFRRKQEEETDLVLNTLDPEEIQERFQNWDEEDGGFADLWESASPTTKLAIQHDLELEIKNGRDANDWRLYDEIGRKYRERMNTDEPGTKKIYENEDIRASIAEKTRRRMVMENQEAEARNWEPEAENPDQILQKFAEDFPDIVQDPKLYSETILEVDRLIREASISGEQLENKYDLYKTAGEKVMRREAIQQTRG